MRLLLIVSVMSLLTSAGLASCRADDESSLPDWIQELHSDENAVRVDAMQKLAAAGQPAVRPLMKALDSDSPYAQQCAALTLGNLGPIAAEAGATLRKIATDESRHEYVRFYSAWALWKATTDAESALPVIRTGLVSRSLMFRQMAAQTIAEMGPLAKGIAPSLLAALKVELQEGPKRMDLPSDQQFVLLGFHLQNAIKSLKIDALPALLKSLNDQEGDDQFRFTVATLLGELGADAKLAENELKAILAKEMRMRIRASIAVTLWKIAQDSETAIPVLLEALDPNGSDSSGRRIAARGLGEIGETADKVIQTLEASMTDTDSVVRIWSARSHWLLAHDNEVILPVVIAGLDSGQGNDFNNAAEVAAMMKDLAGPAAEKLVAGLSQDQLQYNAKEALVAIGVPGVPALIAGLKHANPIARVRVAEILGQLGSTALAAVPALTDLLVDEDESVQEAAKGAIAKIASNDPNSTNLLLEGLSDPDPSVRLARLKVLMTVNVSAETIPIIGKLLKDADSSVREQAALLLNRNSVNARTQVEALIEASNDADLKVRRAVAQALVNMEVKSADCLSVYAWILESDDVELKRNVVYLLHDIGVTAVSALIQATRDKDEEVVSRAAWSLGSIGRPAHEASERLLELIRHSASKIRAEAALAFAKVEVNVQKSLPILIGLLQNDADPQVWEKCAVAMKELESGAKPAVPILLALMTRTGATVEIQREAMLSIAIIGPPVDVADDLGSVLASATDRGIIEWTCSALSKIGPAALPSLPRLQAIAENQTQAEDVREKAIDCIASIGTPAEAATPLLLRLLNDSTCPSLHYKAGFALQSVGIAATDLPSVASLLDHAAADVRVSACRLIGTLGSAAVTAKPQLLQSVSSDGVPQVRAAALTSVAMVAPNDHTLTELVLRSLSDPAPEVRASAAFALGQLRSITAKDLPLLKNAMNDIDGLVASQALVAIGQIGGDAAGLVPDLVEKLRIERTKSAPFGMSLTGSVAAALQGIGPAAEASIPELLEMTKPQNSMWERRAAIDALFQIGINDPKHVPELIERLSDEMAYVRVWAARTLAEGGADDRNAVSPLTDALKDTDLGVKYWAANALGGFGDEAKGSVSALVALMTDPDSRLKSAAAASLGRIGPSASAACSELLKLTDHSSTQVRINVYAALGQIRSQPVECVPALVRGLADPNEVVASATIDALTAFDIDAVGPLRAAVVDPQNPALRRRAAVCLGRIGAVAQSAIGDLKDRLKDDVGEVSEAAAVGLHDIVQSLRQRPETSDTEAVIAVHQALQAIHASHPLPKALLDDVADAEKFYRDIEPLLSVRRIREQPWIPWVVGVILYGLVLTATWSALLRFRPLTLLWVGDRVRSLEWEVPLPWGLSSLKLPLRQVALLGPFEYHTAVLDAWVQKCAASAYDAFEGEPLIAAHSPHVDSAPIRVKTRVLTTAEGKTAMQHIFAQSRVIGLIQGVGGVGKTSLACELGRAAINPEKHGRISPHLMLPVLIDKSIAADAGLFESIHGKLRTLVPGLRVDQVELVRAMLEKQRILVIVDGLSDWPEKAHSLVNPASLNWTVRAMIVTSRVAESLGGVAREVINVEELAGSTLAVFIEDYLTKCHDKAKVSWKSRFKPDELLKACAQLSTLVGTNKCTAMLSKIFAGQLIELKQNDQPLVHLPLSIRDLIVRYISTLHGKLAPADIQAWPWPEFFRRIRALGWACVKERCHAVSVSLADATEAIGEDNADSFLELLRSRMCIIEMSGDLRDQVQFVLDPIAEYLAAMHVRETFVGSGANRKWSALELKLQRCLSTPNGDLQTLGFRMALKECCRDIRSFE